MTRDHETFELFMESNFDAYDSGSDRYPAVLKAGLRQHGLELSDVLAVTQSGGLWAICTVGVFGGFLRGIMRKRVEVGELIRYTQVNSIVLDEYDLRRTRIVLRGGDGKELARIDPWLGGTDGTHEMTAAYRNRIYRILQQASTSGR